MAVIEKFLGQCVEIPEDRRYYPKQGLWGSVEDDRMVFGLTQPALVLSGGIKDISWLVAEGRPVTAGEAVIFAITSKILYVDTPVAGMVRFNNAVLDDISHITADPYRQGWLFEIRSSGNMDGAALAGASHKEYLDALRHTDGFKNPEGVKGGVSGMCKAVYSGIGQQKISGASTGGIGAKAWRTDKKKGPKIRALFTCG